MKGCAKCGVKKNRHMDLECIEALKCENQYLKLVLKKISDPFEYFKGSSKNGEIPDLNMILLISNDATTLKQWALDALNE